MSRDLLEPVRPVQGPDADVADNKSYQYDMDNVDSDEAEPAAGVGPKTSQIVQKRQQQKKKKGFAEMFVKKASSEDEEASSDASQASVVLTPRSGRQAKRKARRTKKEEKQGQVRNTILAREQGTNKNVQVTDFKRKMLTKG